MKIDDAGELDVIFVCFTQPERDVFENVDVSAISVVEAWGVDKMDCEIAVRKRINLDVPGILKIVSNNHA